MDGTRQFRAVLDEITADHTLPARLADRALTGGTRRRRRRQVLTGIGAALAVAAVGTAIVVPLGVTRHLTGTGSTAAPAHSTSARPATPLPPLPTATDASHNPVNVLNTAAGPPPPTPKYAILSYWASGTVDGWWAWDPASHKYIHTGQRSVKPSIEGGYGLVMDVPDVHGRRWAVASWADAIHGRRLSWQQWPHNGAVMWAPDRTTLVVIDQVKHTTRYLDPVMNTSRTVPWPPQVTAVARKMIGYGVDGQNHVVLWSVDPNGILVHTLDDRGVLLDEVLVPDLALAGFQHGVDSYDRSTVSPDGAYAMVQSGWLLDLNHRRLVKFSDEHGRSAISAGFANGWYDSGHLMQVSVAAAHAPPVLSTYDTSGHLVNSLPLRGLPGVHSGGMIVDPYLSRIGPATAGAVVF